MKVCTIRTLGQEDAGQLLKFELANRDWFERHIAPRGDAFYSEEGVLGHIREFLAAHRSGTLHPCLIVGQDGEILGRANLKNIEAGGAEVGYRIAQKHAGKGLATFALKHLVELASTQWRLPQLVAYVAEPNLASARVLERCGFVRGPRVQNLETIAGVCVDGHRFDLEISPAVR